MEDHTQEARKSTETPRYPKGGRGKPHPQKLSEGAFATGLSNSAFPAFVNTGGPASSQNPEAHPPDSQDDTHLQSCHSAPRPAHRPHYMTAGRGSRRRTLSEPSRWPIVKACQDTKAALQVVPRTEPEPLCEILKVRTLEKSRDIYQETLSPRRYRGIALQLHARHHQRK